MRDQKDQLLEQNLGSIENLPTLPMVLRQIQKVIQSSSSSMDQIAAVVAKDQALASRTIRLVNSAFYGMRERVTSISHAIGAIIGGMVHAMAGIEAKSIGSIAGTKTEICVGSDYLVQKTIAETRNALEFYRRNIAKIDQTLSPLLQQLQKGHSLEQQKKDFLAQIMEKRKQMKKNITVMESRLKHLERKAIADPSAMIKASEKIYPGVTVKISGAIKTFETPADHCSLLLNSKSCEIETGAY
jgi:uncharacterized protein (DUF342 family)